MRFPGSHPSCGSATSRRHNRLPALRPASSPLPHISDFLVHTQRRMRTHIRPLAPSSFVLYTLSIVHAVLSRLFLPPISILSCPMSQRSLFPYYYYLVALGVSIGKALMYLL